MTFATNSQKCQAQGFLAYGNCTKVSFRLFLSTGCNTNCILRHSHSFQMPQYFSGIEWTLGLCGRRRGWAVLRE